MKTKQLTSKLISMKQIKLKLIPAFLIVAVSSAFSQTVSDFENLSLTTNSYWSGTSSSGDSLFTSGNAKFPNSYSGYWASGWAYSNVSDSVTAGYGNLSASRAGSGYLQSSNYAVGQQNAKIILQGTAAGKEVQGMYVCNGTYAALSMENGDAFAKKFGGASGNDADFFLLTVKSYFNGSIKSDSINFYLADFRFSDNSKDYIVKNWTWLDLSSLGNTDSLVFTLSSSDVGQFGINTPLFFCVDDFTTADSPTNLIATKDVLSLSVYPNPCVDLLSIETSAWLNSTIALLDVTGKEVLNQKINADLTNLNLSTLPNGMYLLTINNNQNAIQYKVFKN